MNSKNSFGESLVKYRKEKGLTQKDLAEKLNVSDKAVSRWETGKNYPDIETLGLLADLLDVTINELLKGDLKITKKKSPYRKCFVITIFILILIYIFPIYNWLSVVDANYYGSKESSYLLFRGLPSYHWQIRSLITDAEGAFSEVGISEENAEQKYGELGQYCITYDYKDVVSEKHNVKVCSVMLNTYTAEHPGYIWVRYNQEGLDKNGEIVMGGWKVYALWCLEKNKNGEWYVCDIKEGP